MKKYFSIVILALLGASFAAKAETNIDTIHVVKIRDQGVHNAFNDLIRGLNKT